MIHNRNAMTLTELLVASILISVVMIAAASYSLTVKRSYDTTHHDAIISMRLSKAINRIAKDASLAIGDLNNPGIRTYQDPSNLTDQSICFRHDTSQTPHDYTDDTWVCYYHGNSLNIHRNYGTNPAQISLTEACTTSIKCADGTSNKTHVIQLPEIDTTNTNGDYYTVVKDGDGYIQYVDLFFTSRPKPDQIQDPISNPDSTITTRVIPLGHSR